jgi:hypothetical protein
MPENPYASPVCTDPGIYDWTLFRRIVRASAVLFAVFLCFDVFEAVRLSGSFNPFRWAVVVQQVGELDLHRLVELLKGAVS